MTVAWGPTSQPLGHLTAEIAWGPTSQPLGHLISDCKMSMESI